jgi:hypothetical protein
MNNYRLDRTFGKAQSFKEADNNRDYWLQKSAGERLRAAWYLISCAYRFDLDSPPRLDKRVFSMRKHKV